MSKTKQPGEFRKIDIYAKSPMGHRYLCSTNWSPNLKAARERYALSNDNAGGYAASDLYACYADE